MSEEVQQPEAAPTEEAAQATQVNAITANLPVPGYPYPLRVTVGLVPELEKELDAMPEEERKMAIMNIIINMFAESMASLQKPAQSPLVQPQQQGPRRTEGGLILP